MVYEQEVVVPLHFKKYAAKITHVLKLDITSTRDKRMFQLQKLEEDKATTLQHQEVHN